MDMDNFPRIHDDMQVEAEKLVGFLRRRRSTRVYRKRSVPRDVITDLIESGKYAPTGGNLQSLRYLVVQDPGVLDELKNLCIEAYRVGLGLVEPDPLILNDDPELHEALRSEATYYQPLFDHHERGEDALFYDTPVVMVIHAHHPIATRSEAVRSLLEIPEKHEVYMAFTLGYPAVKYYRLSDRKVPRVRWI
jgi:nitroreductase